MKVSFAFFLLCFASSCDVVDPTLLTGSVEEISSEAFVNVAVSILHESGYTIGTVDHAAGLITTEWRDDSSYASQAFSGVSRRTRISIVIDLFASNVNVQMTRQKKTDDHPWRNDGLSSADKDKMKVILVQIQERVRAISQPEAEAGTTDANVGNFQPIGLV